MTQPVAEVLEYIVAYAGLINQLHSCRFEPGIVLVKR